MKCELCKQNDAETAVSTVKDGVEDELYVCRECAEKERARRQKKSLRTRRDSSRPQSGVSMTVTRIGGGEKPPPIIEAIMNAVEGVVSEINGDAAAKAGKKGGKDKEGGKDAKGEEEPLVALPCKGVKSAYRIRGGLHLEGLFLIGELEAAKRAFRAVGMSLEGITAQGLKEPGHIYTIMARKDAGEAAARMLDDVLEQEANARARLAEDDMVRVMGDAICRALATLRSCRLLSHAELLDILSPIRLAVMNRYLDGLTLKEVDSMMTKIEFPDDERPESFDQATIDSIDSGLADEMNGRFENVILTEEAERRFM